MSDWALITGASAGIGHEFARIFAENHHNLILVSRNEARLQTLATELRNQHEIETVILPKDLARPNAASEIFSATANTPVSTLVNNAGFGNYGAFASTSLDTQTVMMEVNMTALVQLTHYFVQPMLAMKRGRILNVASIAAFQPGPLINVYYASKAFVYSFSYALANELTGTGVTVTALCPGTTRTEFFERAHIHMKRPWPLMDARTVALQGYRGMIKGKRVVVPGLMNRIMSILSPCAPACLTSAIVRRIHERG